MKILELQTSRKEELVNITRRVQEAVTELGGLDGVCTIYVPHTTAGVTINEGADPDVVRDILMALERIVSNDWPYRHKEGNSPAHIKASMMGSSVQVLVQNGRLQLGTWQAIFFCEFDGPRRRRFWLDVRG
ncbi:MAG: secondary thiamine-phosphate synthase enzyme YjbQ [candidate division KSB1 bacterium]|nr:secondary thiamine-phosphate synthase enzyme YjbQ [candidate division KSB1 bacterium]MDQ7065483.1 secondary thiamine-phosphate synthase enzyme YjbQ [candidate division KSB1 bacterium]